MKFLSASFALLLAGMALAASDEEPVPFVEGEIPDELFDPTGLFVVAHCRDPLRTRGQPERPVTGMLWSTLTEEMRTQFNVLHQRQRPHGQHPRSRTHHAGR